MSTTTVRNRTNRTSNTLQTDSDAAAWLALAGASMNYFTGGKPKYALVREFVTLPIINAVESAFETARELWGALKPRQGGVSVTEFDGRDAFTVGFHNGTGLQFAGLVHDAKGPMVDKNMRLIEVEAKEDIEFDGVVVVEKGRKLLKAVTQDYLAKIKAAA